MDSLGWLECWTGTGALKVRQDCEWENESCLRGFMCVSVCVTDRQRGCGTLFRLHTCCMYCVDCGKTVRMLIRQTLRQDEAVQCALVWLSIRWRRRLVHVFLKWERKRGCSDTRISNDWRGTEGKRVSEIEMEGIQRMTTWKSDMGGGGVLREQPALHAGQVVQHSTPRGYIFPMWPTLANAHLCVHCVCMPLSVAIIPSSRSTHSAPVILLVCSSRQIYFSSTLNIIHI